MIRQRSGFEPLRGERDKTSHRVVLPSLRQRGGAGGGVRPSPSTPCTLHSPLRHTPAVRSTWTHGRLVRSARPPRAPLVHDFVRLSGSCSPRKLSLYVDSVCLSRKASSALLAVLASWRFKSHLAPPLPDSSVAANTRARGCVGTRNCASAPLSHGEGPEGEVCFPQSLLRRLQPRHEALPSGSRPLQRLAFPAVTASPSPLARRGDGDEGRFSGWRLHPL